MSSYEAYQFNTGLAAENKQRLFYRQGIKDGVFILKKLGVLA